MSKAAKTLHKNVITLLEKARWSGAELARQTGIAQPQMARYLAKDDPVTPGIEVLEKVAEAFGVSIADLFREDASPAPRIEREPISETLKAQTAEIARQAAKEAIQEMLKPGSIMDPVAAVDRRIEKLQKEAPQPATDPASERILEAMKDPKKLMALHHFVNGMHKFKISDEGRLIIEPPPKTPERDQSKERPKVTKDKGGAFRKKGVI